MTPSRHMRLRSRLHPRTVGGVAILAMSAGVAAFACGTKMYDWTDLQSGLVPPPADARSMLPETLLAAETAAEPGVAPARTLGMPTRPWSITPRAVLGVVRCAKAPEGCAGTGPTAHGVDGMDPASGAVFEAGAGGGPDPGRRRVCQFAALRVSSAGRIGWRSQELAPAAGTVLVSTKNRARAPASA